MSEKPKSEFLEPLLVAGVTPEQAEQVADAATKDFRDRQVAMLATFMKEHDCKPDDLVLCTQVGADGVKVWFEKKENSIIKKETEE